MTHEERVEGQVTHLIEQSKSLLATFLGGRNPTEAQLRRLQGAIDALDTFKVCGHTLREDCSCAEAQS